MRNYGRENFSQGALKSAEEYCHVFPSIFGAACGKLAACKPQWIRSAGAKKIRGRKGFDGGMEAE